MPSESLKSKLDGNQLDLSLSSLTTVPVKELSALPKATRLDLSCNLLTIIEPDFCMLVHLVELDLSKNQLSRLPDNFGDLQKLQRLDLYHNKLTYLPLTFCRLNALKWLDLRDNPLEDSSLVAAAGDCLSDAKCRNCAKEVVTYMKKVQSDHERERQKKLNEQRALEASRKAEIEREQQRQRAEKKAEKERRRLELLKKNSEKVNEMQENNDEESANHSKMKSHHGLDAKPERNGLSCCQFILTLLLLAIAAVCGLYVYCSGATSKSIDDFCVVAMHWFNEVIFRIQNIYDQLITRQQVQDG